MRNERGAIFPSRNIETNEAFEETIEKAKQVLSDYESLRDAHLNGPDANELFNPPTELFDTFLACIPTEGTPRFSQFIDTLKLQHNSKYAPANYATDEEKENFDPFSDESWQNGFRVPHIPNEFMAKLMRELVLRASESLKEVFGPLCRDIAKKAIDIAQHEDLEAYRETTNLYEIPNLNELYKHNSFTSLLKLGLEYDGDFDTALIDLYQINNPETTISEPRLTLLREFLEIASYKRYYNSGEPKPSQKEMITKAKSSIEQLSQDSNFIICFEHLAELTQDEQKALLRTFSIARNNANHASTSTFFRGELFDGQYMVSYGTKEHDEVYDLGLFFDGNFPTFPYDKATKKDVGDIAVSTRIFAESIVQNIELLSGADNEHAKLFKQFTARGNDRSSSPATAAMFEGILSIKDVIIQLLHTSDFKAIQQEYGTAAALEKIAKERLPARIAAIIPMGVIAPMSLKGQKMTDVIEHVTREDGSEKVRLSCPVRHGSKKIRTQLKRQDEGYYKHELQKDTEGKSIRDKSGDAIWSDSFKYPDSHNIGCPVSRQDKKNEMTGLDALTHAFVEIYKQVSAAA